MQRGGVNSLVLLKSSEVVCAHTTGTVQFRENHGTRLKHLHQGEQGL